MQTLTRHDRPVRFSALGAALWLLIFVAMMVVMLVFALLPGPALYGPGVSEVLFWPFAGAALIYGIVTALAAHRLETWRYAMWGKFWGPGMMGVFGAVTAGAAMWLFLLLAVPQLLAPTARSEFTLPTQLVAVRGGGRTEPGLERWVVEGFGYRSLPYEGQLAAPFGRFDRVPLDTPMGLTALDYGSTYTTPVPVTITGRRNALILVVDNVVRGH